MMNGGEMVDYGAIEMMLRIVVAIATVGVVFAVYGIWRLVGGGK